LEDDGNSDFEDVSDEAPAKSKPKKSKKDWSLIKKF
jgi:hypothetical protein